MSTQRFSPEFKEEAVRQVVERGYRVPHVRGLAGLGYRPDGELEYDDRRFPKFRLPKPPV